MPIEENKAIISRIIEGYNKRNLAVFDECFARSFILFTQDHRKMDIVGYKNFCGILIKWLPDIQVTIDDIIAEGDRAAFRFTWTGTNTGGFMDKPSTGERITVTEDYFVRFANGKIVEYKNLIGSGSRR